MLSDWTLTWRIVPSANLQPLQISFSSPWTITTTSSRSLYTGQHPNANKVPFCARYTTKLTAIWNSTIHHWILTALTYRPLSKLYKGRTLTSSENLRLFARCVQRKAGWTHTTTELALPLPAYPSVMMSAKMLGFVSLPFNIKGLTPKIHKL